jgi:septal ring factor EnvC (AmiA/AmiB activator)
MPYPTLAQTIDEVRKLNDTDLDRSLAIIRLRLEESAEEYADLRRQLSNLRAALANTERQIAQFSMNEAVLSAEIDGRRRWAVDSSR